MTQALITVNAVPGSDDDLPIDTLVQLDNTGNGGELTYAWTILDQPPGAVDALSAAAIQNPTFTPRKEGAYLIQVVVNASLSDEVTNTVTCSVRQLKTRTRVPAAGETLETDSADGWATDVNTTLRLVDTLRADPGIVVAQLGFNATANDVVRFTSNATLKAGLPGEETVPVVTLALATQAYILTDELGLVIAAVDGGALTSGKLAYVRVFGMQKTVTVAAMVAGDTLYASNTGTVDRVAGTNSRRIGKGLAASPGDIWFDGAMLAGGAGVSTPPLIPTDEKNADYNAAVGELVVMFADTIQLQVLLPAGTAAGDQIGIVTSVGSTFDVILDPASPWIGPAPILNPAINVYGCTFVWDAINSFWVLNSTCYVP